jgi:hypothetical protein
MRNLVLLAAMVFALALAAPCAEVVSNCDRAELAKAPPTRTGGHEARDKLSKKTEIPVASAILSKLPDDGLSIDVVVNDTGAVECFILYALKTVTLTDADKFDLRSAIETALQEWRFTPYRLNDKRVTMMARLPLRIEHHGLAVVPAFEIKGPPR